MRLGSMTEQSERGRETLIKLEQALQRIVEGCPKRTKADGRINLSRINQEAGLSSGGIYYYPDFVESTKKYIQSLKESDSSVIKHGNISKESKLREQRDKERQLKEQYREQRDQMKTFCDGVVAKNAQLEFALFEALEQISQLEHELVSSKVTSINGKIK